MGFGENRNKYMTSQTELPWAKERSGGQSFFYHFTFFITTWHSFSLNSEIVHSRICKALGMISLAKCDVKKYSCCQIVSIMIKHTWKIPYSHLPSLHITSCQFLYGVLLSLWNTGWGFSSQENINNREKKKKKVISYKKNTGFVPDIEVFHTEDQHSSRWVVTRLL